MPRGVAVASIARLPSSTDDPSGSTADRHKHYNSIRDRCIKLWGVYRARAKHVDFGMVNNYNLGYYVRPASRSLARCRPSPTSTLSRALLQSLNRARSLRLRRTSGGFAASPPASGWMLRWTTRTARQTSGGDTLHRRLSVRLGSVARPLPRRPALLQNHLGDFCHGAAASPRLLHFLRQVRVRRQGGGW